MLLEIICDKIFLVWTKSFETWLECTYGLRISQTNLSINLYSESLVITYEYPFLFCKLSNYIHTSKTCVYYFWFPLLAKSIYCTLFLLDCFNFAYGCICIYVHSVILFISVINLCSYVGLLQFCGAFFSFFLSLSFPFLIFLLCFCSLFFPFLFLHFKF